MGCLFFFSCCYWYKNVPWIYPNRWGMLSLFSHLISTQRWSIVISNSLKYQYAKKVMPNNPGLVDFSVRLMDSILCLHSGQEEILNFNCNGIFNLLMVYFLFKALFSRLVPEKNGKREFSNIMLGRLKVKTLYVYCIIYMLTYQSVHNVFSLNLIIANV